MPRDPGGGLKCFGRQPLDKVEVACIDEELYPEAPKIRRFSIMLTGNEVCIEGKGKVTTC